MDETQTHEATITIEIPDVHIRDEQHKDEICQKIHEALGAIGLIGTIDID